MKYICRIFVIVAILALSALVLIAYLLKPKYDNKGVNILEKEEKIKTVQVFDGNKPLKILVLGVDKTATLNMTEEENGLRTDTIMIFGIYPKEKKVKLLSIPRDSYIKIHGYGQNKINSAFGNIVYPNGGLELLIDTLKDFLDLDIDHYAIVDYKSVSKLIDAIGGVDIDWQYEDYHYEDNWTLPPLEIDLKHGINHLDGMGAVSYLRARKIYKNQDLGRIDAQQDFLMMLFSELKNPTMLFKIPELLGIVDEFVETDLNYAQIATLAKFALDLDRENIQTDKLVGYSKTVKIGKDEVSVYVVNKEDARKKLRISE